MVVATYSALMKASPPNALQAGMRYAWLCSLSAISVVVSTTMRNVDSRLLTSHTGSQSSLCSDMPYFRVGHESDPGRRRNR